MHALGEMADWTIFLLTEVTGNLDRYREIMADSSAAHEFAVSVDESGFCYGRVETKPRVDCLLEAQREAEYLLDMPVAYTEDGAQLVTRSAWRRRSMTLTPTSTTA